MWLITNIGFFSVVEKRDDRPQGTLTVRARVRDDLERLRDQWLPELGAISEDPTADYRFRARAPRAAVAKAASRAVDAIDYSNFKDSVAHSQGIRRSHLYHDVWEVLMRLQQRLEFR